MNRTDKTIKNTEQNFLNNSKEVAQEILTHLMNGFEPKVAVLEPAPPKPKAKRNVNLTPEQKAKRSENLAKARAAKAAKKNNV